MGDDRVLRRLRIGDLVLDPGTREISRDGRVLDVSPLSFRLIWTLAEDSPNLVTLDELADRVWGDRVVSPETITQRVKLARQALGDDAGHPTYIGLVRGEGYRMLAPVMPLGTGNEGKFGRIWLALAIGSTMLIAAAALLMLRSEQPARDMISASAPEEKSIAVLAFEDLSENSDQAYLAEGIAEELLNLLAELPDLRVAARTSAFSLRNKDLTVREIASRLGVATILEGSLRKSGNRLRVTVHLIDGVSEKQIWSQKFDRKLEDIFALQDEIAGRVTEELRVTLLGEVPRTTRIDPTAYTLYLQARQLNHRNTAESSAEALPLLERALELEPDFALGIAEYARATFMAGMGDHSDPERMEATWQKCIALIEHARRIAPDEPYINAWLGWIDVLYRGDLEAGLEHIDRALALGPNNDDANRIALVLYLLRDLYERSIALSRNLLARDPLCVVCHFATASAYVFLDRIEEARSSLETLLVIAEGERLMLSQAMMGALHLVDDKPEAALALFREGVIVEPFRTRGMLLALHDLGHKHEFDRIFAEARDAWSGGERYWPAGLASVYAWIGDADKAFRWLLEGIENHDYRRQPFLEIRTPYFRPIRNDPRWDRAFALAESRRAEALSQ